MTAIAASPVNYWSDSACARAFWGQQELPPYRQLLEDTIRHAQPRPGDHWLDLGCGCGELTRAIWTKSCGSVSQIVGLDCARENEKAFDKLCRSVQPRPAKDQIRFMCDNFSAGLNDFGQGRFHGVISGLAIQYAESYSPTRGCWTTEAYDNLLAEIHRVLCPGGSLVFSVNVPEPSWGRVAFQSLGGIFHARKPGRYLTRSWQMMRYGGWLKKEARQGRFHFLDIAQVAEKLVQAGFSKIKHQLTYADQAYVIQACKSA
jgi:ubiquinone/menaquinone biosynthesis C-methylase UbiE